MDKILKGVLKGALSSVEYSIDVYNDVNDIRYIEVSIEGLNEMIASVEEAVKTPDLNKFLTEIKGMRDKLNVIVENHKKSDIDYKNSGKN